MVRGFARLRSFTPSACYLLSRGAFSNLVSYTRFGLVAYTYYTIKPALDLQVQGGLISDCIFPELIGSKADIISFLALMLTPQDPDLNAAINLAAMTGSLPVPACGVDDADSPS